MAKPAEDVLRVTIYSESEYHAEYQATSLGNFLTDTSKLCQSRTSFPPILDPVHVCSVRCRGVCLKTKRRPR